MFVKAWVYSVTPPAKKSKVGGNAGWYCQLPPEKKVQEPLDDTRTIYGALETLIDFNEKTKQRLKSLEQRLNSLEQIAQNLLSVEKRVGKLEKEKKKLASASIQKESLVLAASDKSKAMQVAASHDMVVKGKLMSNNHTSASPPFGIEEIYIDDTANNDSKSSKRKGNEAKKAVLDKDFITEDTSDVPLQKRKKHSTAEELEEGECDSHKGNN
jgi:cell division septum initiation protein DivIVA